MTAATTRYRRARIAVALLIGALLAIGTGQLASAHTDFDSSSPTDGAVVDGPLTEVVVNFTNAARRAGDGFQLLDPTGTLISPSAIDETDGTSFVLTFDPPLEAGTYGVRWSVQAGDAHPIDGSFRFEVTGAPPTTETAAEAVPPAAAGAAPSTTTAAATTDDMDMDAADHAAMSDDTLDAFLDGGSTDGDSAVVGRTGRILSIAGLIFGLGVLAALVWTTRGHRDELLTHLNWVRLAGLVMFTGGLIEYAALTENDPNTSFGSILSTKPALATALKMAGGLAVMLGFHERAGRIVAPARSLSAAVATAVAPPTDASSATPRRHDDSANEHRWTPTSTAAVGLLGYALVLISFWFDGHTVSKGPWAIHSLVNLVHLGAAAVWGGGVFAMTTVAWMRRRRSERIGLAAMVVRFSSIATVSLAAVIVAGLVMTWMVLDTPGDLFGTSWGRVLIAKTAVVAIAASLGGYNHFRLRPALEQRPDDPHLARELRVSLSIESAVFVVVVVLTAILVASAT